MTSEIASPAHATDCTRANRLTSALIPLIFLFATLLCYWPSLNGSFLWDDENLVVNNPWIKSPVLTGEMFRHWLQPESNAPYYRPIQSITLAIDYYFWGLNPLGYHLANISLHAIAGYLLFRLLCRIGEKTCNLSERAVAWAAFAIALIWTIHPIHNAGVAYISGRADAMGAMFALSAWLIALRGLDRERGKTALWYGLSAALMLLALLSKEISAVWMGLFTIYLFAVRKDVSLPRKLAMVGGLLLVTAVWAFLRTLPVEPGASAQTVQTSWPQRTVLVARAIGDYASLLVAPIELHMERSVWPEWNREQTTWLAVPGKLGVLGITGVVALMFMIAGCCWKAPGRPVRLAGAIWFGLCFLPISNLFPLNAQVAEHWIYTASVGAFVFAAGCVMGFPVRLQKVCVVVIVCWSAGLAVRTNLRAAEWRDPVVFYQQIIKSMGGTPRVFNNLGVALTSRGRLDEAERVFRYALQRYPDNPALLSNLGTTLSKGSRAAEAEVFLQSASQSADSRATGDGRAAARGVAAEVRSQQSAGKTDAVLATVHEARKQMPDRWDLLHLEAEALLETEGTLAAIGAVEAYARKHWYSKEAHSMLGRLWYRQGEPEKSLASWKNAARLDVWASEPWTEMAKIEAERKNFAAACDFQEKAVKRSRGDQMALLIYAKFLRDAGRDEDAAVALLDARELAAKGDK